MFEYLPDDHLMDGRNSNNRPDQSHPDRQTASRSSGDHCANRLVCSSANTNPLCLNLVHIRIQMRSRRSALDCQTSGERAGARRVPVREAAAHNARLSVPDVEQGGGNTRQQSRAVGAGSRSFESRRRPVGCVAVHSR
jgi:hypothetical protein